MGSGNSKDNVSPKRKEYPDYRPVKKYQVLYFCDQSERTKSVQMTLVLEVLATGELGM